MEAGSPEVVTVDTHSHISMPDYGRDLDLVIARARQRGVSFIEIGFDVESSRLALGLARILGGKCAAGIHPLSVPGAAEQADTAWKSIEWLIESGGAPVVAVGEVGLDFSRGSADRDAQIDCFRQGLDLSCRLRLPAVIHERDAEDDAHLVLKDFSLPCPPVFHCFNGDFRYASRCLDLGGYLGVGGISTYPRNNELRETLRRVPVDRLLLETDSPYLTPQPHRGARNEPAFVLDVRDRVAQILGVSPERISEITTSNARRAFGVDVTFPR